MSRPKTNKIRAEVVIQIDKDELNKIANTPKRNINVRERVCVTCETSTMEKMMYCSRCKYAYYCSEKCQKKNWPKHKLRCKVLAKRKELENRIQTIITENPISILTLTSLKSLGIVVEVDNTSEFLDNLEINKDDVEFFSKLSKLELCRIYTFDTMDRFILKAKDIGKQVGIDSFYASLMTSMEIFETAMPIVFFFKDSDIIVAPVYPL